MKRVFIVEDHSAFAQALELVLKGSGGMEIVLARTVAEGRAMIPGGGTFDLVVLDLNLPDGEGTELVPDLREHHPETPIAVLSAREDVAAVAANAGADEAIRKDLALPGIISALERLTG